MVELAVVMKRCTPFRESGVGRHVETTPNIQKYTASGVCRPPIPAVNNSPSTFYKVHGDRPITDWPIERLRSAKAHRG